MAALYLALMVLSIACFFLALIVGRERPGPLAIRLLLASLVCAALSQTVLR